MKLWERRALPAVYLTINGLPQVSGSQSTTVRGLALFNRYVTIVRWPMQVVIENLMKGTREEVEEALEKLAEAKVKAEAVYPD